MNVLWIKSDFILPADTGGKIRTKNLLYELARLARVTYLSYMPPDTASNLLHELSDVGITAVGIPHPEETKSGAAFYLRVLSRLGSSRPYVANKYVSREMRDRLAELVRRGDYDVVVCDFLEMAWCWDVLSMVPNVLFEHNVETTIWRRLYKVERNPLKKAYLAYEKNRVERFERTACAGFDAVFTVSEQDSGRLRADFGAEDLTSIPTGVDTGFFHPMPGERSNCLVLSGSMDWMANIDAFWWFYRDIYPPIRAAVPDVTLRVVGRRPPSEIQAMAKTDTSVTVTGTVDDVRPHYAAGSLFVVPLRVGGGTRIKLYEAMAMSKCVLSTTIGAEGLPLLDGHQIAIADGAESFARRTIELLNDSEQRRSLATRGYEFVTTHCTWGSAASIMLEALAAVVTQRSGVVGGQQ